jgi:hypothetical protein
VEGGALPGQGAGPRLGIPPEEEEGRGGEKEKKEKEIRKKEKKIGKRKIRRRKKEKEFRKLGEIQGKLGERGKRLRIFLGFSDTGVNSGTAVMARRTSRRDRGVRGIPGAVADSGAGAARDGRWPGCGRCRRYSRHAPKGRERGGKTTGVLKGVVELSGNVLKTRVF